MVENLWTREYFDQRFKQADPWAYFTSDYEQRKYKKQIAVIRDHAVEPLNAILEIGCAEGAHTRMLAEAFPSSKITAIDISPRAIQRAQYNLRSYTKVEPIQADIIEFVKNIPDQCYDVIVWSESVYYLGDRLSLRQLFEFLTKVIGKLRQGGLLCMANIIEQPNSPETLLTKRPLMECYHSILCSMAIPLHRSTYRERKREDGPLYEYQIWLFRRNTPKL